MSDFVMNPDFEEQKLLDPFAPSYTVNEESGYPPVDDDEADAGYVEMASPEDVPDGSVRQVIEWVGQDTTRAHRALVAEEAHDKPRISLTSYLEAHIAEGG